MDEGRTQPVALLMCLLLSESEGWIRVNESAIGEGSICTVGGALSFGYSPAR